MMSPSVDSCDQKAKWYSFGNGNVKAGPHRTCGSIRVQLIYTMLTGVCGVIPGLEGYSGSG
jgi:hypothetical protein